jgi:hypothetical protein
MPRPGLGETSLLSSPLFLGSPVKLHERDISDAPPKKAGKAVLVLEDGTSFRGKGIGAFGTVLGEVCFNTSMTGYQEILTDPSYAGQIITFTFPHIGNVGANGEDIESSRPACRDWCCARTSRDPPTGELRPLWTTG